MRRFAVTLSRFRRWFAPLPRWAARGAAVGALTLGAGGRMAMYAFARLTGRAPHVTLGGVARVLVAGAIAGAVGAMLYGAVARWLLPRAHPVGRGVAVGALLLLVYAPGIRPPWPLTYARFAPAFLGYGLLLTWRWPRGGRGRAGERGAAPDGQSA